MSLMIYRLLSLSQAEFRTYPQVLCGDITDSSVPGDHLLLGSLTTSHDKKRIMGSLLFIFDAHMLTTVYSIGNSVASLSKPLLLYI